MDKTAINKRIRKVQNIIDDIRDELNHYHKRSFVRLVVDCWGSLGIIFTALQDYESHGEYLFPLTHKYYNDLVFYLTYALNDNKARRKEINRTLRPTKAMARYQKEKEKARRDAIEIQIKVSNSAQSWEEVNQLSDYLHRLGKRYGLLKEFKENGLL